MGTKLYVRIYKTRKQPISLIDNLDNDEHTCIIAEIQELRNNDLLLIKK
jgi:hypothetical protein